MTRSNQFANIAIGMCCIVVTAVALRREFSPVAVASAGTNARAQYIENWQHLLADDAMVGSPAARLKIVEFVDFECPFCAELAERIARLQKENPGEISLTLRHFPIAGHKFARPAAVAFECAKPHGRAKEVYNALFAKQDSLGLRPFREYARDAGIDALEAFDQCNAARAPARIDEDIKYAERLGVRATPTLLVNGWMLSLPPTYERFKEILESHRNGRDWNISGDTVRVVW